MNGAAFSIGLFLAIWGGYYCGQLFQKAGRPKAVGVLVGFLMFPVGFLIANGLYDIWTSAPPEEGDPTNNCPACGEVVHAGARRCTYCAVAIPEEKTA